eukprot:COSAG01_NODE_47237_length_392_cov_1.051195_1_plen_39_part_01
MDVELCGRTLSESSADDVRFARADRAPEGGYQAAAVPVA